MEPNKKVPVYLGEEDMRSIARICDIALKTNGIQIVKQTHHILEILDAAMQQLKLQDEVIDGEINSDC